MTTCYSVQLYKHSVCIVSVSSSATHLIACIALHRMTAKLNYVPFATRIILNEFKNCVQWFENCSCVCECVLNAAENYVLTCSHLRTTFVIQHKLHAHGLSSASKQASILHRVWLLLAASMTATATATAVVAMLSLWLIISMCDYKMVCVHGVSVGFIIIVVFWSVVECGCEDYTKFDKMVHLKRKVKTE